MNAGVDGKGAYMDESTRRTWSAAVEANYLTLYRVGCARLAGAELREDAESFVALSGLPLPLGNAVVRVNWGELLSAAAVRARIEATLAPFVARGVPGLWYVWPSTLPTTLGDALEAYGLAHVGDPSAMALNLERWRADVPTPPGLRIQAVADAATHERWVETLSAGFEFPEASRGAVRALSSTLMGGPPISQYLGYLDGAPVATATVVRGGEAPGIDGEGVAGIYNVATRPEARGRGVAPAMAAAALRASRDLGCHTAILIATALGETVYQRLGFRECCRVGEYTWRSTVGPTNTVLG